VVNLTAIAASKLQHDIRETYIQANGASVVAATAYLHVPVVAGTINAISAMIMTAATSTGTVTVDVQTYVSGSWTTVLSAPLSITSATAINTAVVGTVTVTTYTAAQPMRVVVTATGSALPQGLIVNAQLFEQSQ
jgi:hypothetical protein